MRCINAFHGIMATVIGVLIAVKCSNNIMDDTYWLADSYTWFGFPYFLYDIWAMYNTHLYANLDLLGGSSWTKRLQHFSWHNVSMLVHHICLPLVFFPILVHYRHRRGDYFVGVLYSTEAALPFISIRFILAQLKLKHTPAYIFFGLLMIAVFFITRVLVFPFLYWKYSLYSGQPLAQVPFNIPLKCNLGCLTILVLQVFFLYLMVRGAFRVFYKMYQFRKSV